ncbi:hypothetical protein, partial [Flavobacterium sp. UBA4197]|uniref:hypothetical protein n=1 Tax=Flavobacterium sp. UBA4197 TaxID=1946546 RepID=UPI00257D6580
MKINAQGKTITTGDEVIISEYLGGVSATTVMQVPEDSEAHVLPNVALKRRIRFNPMTEKFEGHNGTEWTALGFDQQLKDAIDFLNAGFLNKADLVDGKIPLSQINDALVGAVNYQGTYDAATNNPALPAASVNKGKYWVVNVEGAQQGNNFKIGDWVISNGTAWGRVPKATDVDSTPTAGSNNAVSSGGVADALALKANTIEVNSKLADKVSAIELHDGLILKADLAEVNTKFAVKANIADVNAGLALKADLTDVNTKLADKVSAIELHDGLILKADLAEVNTKFAVKANITDLNAGLALKADTSDVNLKLAEKVSATELHNGLVLKADLTDVNAKFTESTTIINAGLALKADVTDLNLKASKIELSSGLAEKVGMVDLNAGLALKADTIDVNLKLAEKIGATELHEG